jgi:hypothetical protein
MVELLATTALCRAADKADDDRERIVSLHGLSQRLNAARAKDVPERTEEDDVEPPPEGIEITGSL